MSEIFSPNQVQEELRSYLVDTCQHTSLGQDLRSGQNHNAQAFQMGQDRAALYMSFSSWFAVRALINRVTSFRSVSGIKTRKRQLYNFGSKILVFVDYRVFSPQEIAVLYTFLCLVESRGLRGEGVVLPI